MCFVTNWTVSFPVGLAQVWKLSLEPQGRTVASLFEKVTTSGFWGIMQLAGQLCSPHEAGSTVSSYHWREPPRIGRANSSDLVKRTHQEMIKGKRAKKKNTDRTKQKLPPRERCLAPHRRTDPARLKQLFGFRSFLFSCTPRCSHGWDELLFLNCCNNVLELFLQPPFLSSLSLSEYSEAILF